MVPTPPGKLQQGAMLHPHSPDPLAWLCHMEEWQELPEDGPVPEDSGTLALVPPLGLTPHTTVHPPSPAQQSAL